MMKRIALFFAFTAWLAGQTPLPSPTNISNGAGGTCGALAGNVTGTCAANSVKGVRSGTIAALPATCTVGDIYFATNATAGANIYQCAATNTWTAPSSGGGTPGGSDKQVQYNNSTAFGGMAGSAWYNTDLSLVFSSGTDPMLILSANPAGETAGPGSGANFYLNYNGIKPPNTSAASGTQGGYFEADAAGGGNTTIITSGTGGSGGGIALFGGSGGQATLAAVDATGGLSGGVSLGSGNGGDASTGATTNTGGNASDVQFTGGSGGSATTGVGVNQGGQGSDILFTTGAGGAATDGMTNNGGRAGNYSIGLGAGGSGSTSNGADGEFRITGAASATVAKVTRAGRFDLTQDIANYFGLAKITATAAAPGAGVASLHVRAGTNAGTCKLTVNAGTSATEITIVDNIGAGC